MKNRKCIVTHTIHKRNYLFTHLAGLVHGGTRWLVQPESSHLICKNKSKIYNTIFNKKLNLQENGI